MHVLVLQPDSEMYGACRSLLRTMQAMGERRPRVTAVFPYPGPAVEAYHNAGIITHIAELAVLRRSNAGLIGRIRLLIAARRTARKIASQIDDVDLVHANSMTVLTGIGARQHFGAPLVWQLREAPTERGLAARALRQLLRRYATRVAIISQAARELTPVDTPTDLTPNGYDRPFSPTTLERHARPRVGVVGRLLPTKGQDVVLRAMALATHSFDLVIAGSPYPGHEQYATGLTHLAEELGLASHVVFTPFVDPVEPLLDSLDLLVVATTTGEGFSTIALEALAAGVPVVAAARGGITELVDASCGAMAPVNDPAGLARSIDALLTRLQGEDAALRAAARLRASKWSLQASADALLGCWKEAVDQHA